MVTHMFCTFFLKRCAVPKMEPINIAVRFTYVLRHWSLDEWPVEPIGEGHLRW